MGYAAGSGPAITASLSSRGPLWRSHEHRGGDRRRVTWRYRSRRIALAAIAAFALSSRAAADGSELAHWGAMVQTVALSLAAGLALFVALALVGLRCDESCYDAGEWTGGDLGVRRGLTAAPGDAPQRDHATLRGERPLVWLSVPLPSRGQIQRSRE